MFVRKLSIYLDTSFISYLEQEDVPDKKMILMNCGIYSNKEKT